MDTLRVTLQLSPSKRPMSNVTKPCQTWSWLWDCIHRGWGHATLLQIESEHVSLLLLSLEFYLIPRAYLSTFRGAKGKLASPSTGSQSGFSSSGPAPQQPSSATKETVISEHDQKHMHDRMLFLLTNMIVWPWICDRDWNGPLYGERESFISHATTFIIANIRA